MGLVGVVCGLVLQAEQHWVAGGRRRPRRRARLAGAVNGGLIAYVGLPPFVVTLGMLSIARSLAIVLSQNQMIYEFGPYGDTFNAIGGGAILGIANPVWMLDRPHRSSSASSSTSRPGAAISTPSAATRTRRGSPACRSTGSSSRPMSSPA